MASPAFARHETFHPRYGWLKKGFEVASGDSEVFLRSDAHVRLGVGKNMVRSIRYWCHAFKVLEDDPAVGGRAMGSRPSEFGIRLLGDDGLDPYLEDLGSLWLLHWRLLQDPCTATAWWYAFFIHGGTELSAGELTSELAGYVEREFPTARAAESSLKKDASCITRMYGELSSGPVSEESIHCPWAELRLLRPSHAPKQYAFRIGRKPGLTAPLITAACLEYAAARGSDGGRTISLGALTHGPGSPGLAFKLPENSVYGALEATLSLDSSLGLSDTAGIVQLSFSSDPSSVAQEMIRAHYEGAVKQGAVA